MAAAGNRRRATIRRIASRPGRPRGWTAGALGLAMLAAGPGAAQDVPATAGDFGGVGLIEMRNARFRPDGTLEAGAAFRRQRQFWFLGFQALPFLETTFRLTDRLDATAGRGTTTDRAFDVKARLWEESAWRPALAMGAQDVIGTGLYAGEYLVASKRLWDLDLTLGLGWGRLGTGADLGNPLGAAVGPLPGAAADTSGSAAGLASDSLFRGRDAAIFGGLEWSVPPALALGLEGLRAKLEWSGDALRDERGGYPARTIGLRGAGGLAAEHRPAMAAEPLARCRGAFRPWHRPAAAAVAAAGPGPAAGDAAAAAAGPAGAARGGGRGRPCRRCRRPCAAPASGRWR